jgi:hypothetical protein
VPRLDVLEDRTLPSTLTVLNNSDHDPGSLRAVLAGASNGDQIVFDPSLTGQTITLTTGELLLNRDLTITGLGAGQLAVSSNHASRVFEVAGNTTVSLSGLTIANGGGTNPGFTGGGIKNAGTLTVSDSALLGNEVSFEGYGGGIYNTGMLTISHCTLANNGVDVPGYGAANYGGGIYNLGSLAVDTSTFTGNQALYGAGIYNGGSLSVSASTFSSNQINPTDYFFGETPNLGGGGIWNGPAATAAVTTCTFSGNFGTWSTRGSGLDNEGGIFTLDNSTLSGNTATSGGGGIFNRGSLNVTDCTIAANANNQDNDPRHLGGGIANAGTLNLRNSLLAGNTDDGGAPDLSGGLTTSGYNLISDTSGGGGFTTTDLLNIDPLLGPLQGNGGPTQTMALSPASPALNAGDPAQAGVADQRGVVRGGGVNIGAYQASASVFLLTAPDTVTAGTPFDVTVTAVDAFGQVAVGYTGTVTFSTTDPDPGVVLPADYNFLAGDQGSHTFSGGCTLITPGSWTLSATDAAGRFSGSVSVTVQ